MVAVYWPTELPDLRRDSYNQQTGDLRQLSKPDSGPPRIGSKFSRTTDTVQMSVFCSLNLRARFERFYIEETRNGRMPFWMPEPGRNGWALLDNTGRQLLTETGHPILLSANWLCLFGANVPVYASISESWLISFDVFVRG